MQVRNFDYITVGSGFPNNFTIGVVEGHESHGVYASTYTEQNKDQVLELRKNNHGQIAFFNYAFKNMKLPDTWKDSEVLWKNY